MKSIYKYVLSPGQTDLEVPFGARILSTAAQRDNVCIWIEVDVEANRRESRQFIVYATGEDFEPRPAKFIGTVLLHGGSLVFHVYELLL